MLSDPGSESTAQSEEENGFDHLVETTLAFDTSHYIYISGEYDLVAENPITFHDRHLDSNLSLKHVEIIPSMNQLFSEICDEEVRAFYISVKPPYYSSYAEHPGSQKFEELWSSGNIAVAYQNDLEQYCIQYPSQLFFHPAYDLWRSVFDFQIRQTSKYRPTFSTEAFIRACPRYSKPALPDYVAKKSDILDAPALSKLRELEAHSPQLAIWSFYPMTLSGEKIIKTMQDIPQFAWETPQTKGWQKSVGTSFSLCPADSRISFLSRLLNKTSRKAGSGFKYRQQIQIKDDAKAAKAVRNLRIYAPSVTSRLTKTDIRPLRVNPSHFIQRAWCRAVANDATFIIFNCGKYERIGFRHRGSQTLYLSSLINTAECRNPAYGKLHVGLHFAIIQDALNRQDLRSKSFELTGEDSKQRQTKTKRKLEATAERNKHSKRRKVDELRPPRELKRGSSHIKAVSSALSNRNMILVNLNYGVYHSPNPSSFIRRGPSCASGFNVKLENKENQPKSMYRPHQYVSLDISAPIGTGATGTVHRASARIVLESGDIIDHPLIVKLVSLDTETRPRAVLTSNFTRPQDRLLQEYSIYQHLASAGVVEGILPMYGLFEDADSGMLALIMEDGGLSLLDRERRDTGGDGSIITLISEAQRDTLIRTLKNIHKAGVRHHDIRALNILVNSKDEPFIIDFDKAELLTFPAEPFNREMLMLEKLLGGHPAIDIYSS